MEIPFSSYRTFSSDHSQSFSSSLGSSTPTNCCFVSKVRNFSNPFSQICFSSSSSIQRVTRHELRKTEIDYEEREEKPAVFNEPKIRKSSSSAYSGLCSRIEKFVLCKKYLDAMELFEILELEYVYCDVGASTYDALVNACIGLRSIDGVKKVFNYMRKRGFEFDLYMMNRVLLMHVKCGLMLDARTLFAKMPDRNTVSWMIMIGGLVDSRNYAEAFDLFFCMWEQLEEFDNGVPHIFVTMIRASAGLGLIEVGRQIHTCALKKGLGGKIFVACALVDMYSKCDSIQEAQFVFNQIQKKTTVAWNSIIASYALHGYSEEALGMYCDMRDSGAKVDHFTISIVITICARLASLEHAKQAHAALIRYGFGTDMVANSTLIDFYSKWGKMRDARHVFDKMPRKNVIIWNALIAGYGKHGQGEEAIEMFQKMLRERVAPNHVTFLAVLSACSYSGLFEQGWEIFESMSKGHNVKPQAMHYACMIELLGRQGSLDEAFALLKSAPFKPSLNMWSALLTACRMHGNFELGKFAAEMLYGMEPKKLCNYVVVLNIYNSSGKFKEAAGVLQTLKRNGLTMLPACTWIEVKKQPYVFQFGDESHPQTKEIYQKVDSLMVEISRHGYVVENEMLLPDVDEKEQRVLKYHSEKLAIAFGLINSPGWIPLQITQSHRVCGDCHNAIKLITMVTGREIVLRDASRFHHFKNGSCSCGDYW